jgi:hypothetical protein
MELIEMFNQIDGKLDKLLAGGTAAPAASEPPPGFVAVHPTGPRGAGKVRFWPVVEPTGDINYFSYLNRMTRTVNPFSGKGDMFCTPGQWGDAFSGTNGDMPFPEHADKHMNPFDWFTQAELDKIAELAARDAGASWGAGG